jgi:polysaccharide chain length determinant protein (PEP-CTERM system associated)
MDAFDDTSPSAPRKPLAEYLEIPLRRPLLVFLPFAAIVAASLVASNVLPKKYRSSAFILVESETVPDAVVPRMAATGRSDRRMQTIKQEILSRTRLEQVIKETNPYPDSEGRVSMTDMVESMRSATTISVRGDDAFSVDFVHRYPQKAAEVVNRLATLFIEESNRARAQQVEEADSFLGTEVVDARRELEAKEESVRRYKEGHMGTLPEQVAANLSTLQVLQLREQAIGDNLRAALGRQSDLEGQLADSKRGATIPVPGGDPLAEINQLKSQLASLRTRYTDKYPDVQEALARLALLEKKLSSQEQPSNVDGDPIVTATKLRLEQTRREVAILQDKQRELERQIAVLQARIDAAPRTEQELTTLTRDFGNLKENYFALLNRKLDAQRAAKLEQRWKGERFRILDPAHVPERPFFPNRMLFLAAGIVLGLAAGLGAAVLAEILDRSFTSLADVEAAVPYPVLAAVPHIRPLRSAKSRKSSKSRRERERSVLHL